MGGASSPLIWGRAASWLMRMSASVFPSELLPLECFVDDPWAAARGAEAERRRSLATILLFWCSLGLKMSWAKRQSGPELQWVGLQLSLSLGEVILTIPAKFIAKLARGQKDQPEGTYDDMLQRGKAIETGVQKARKVTKRELMLVAGRAHARSFLVLGLA